MDNTICYLNTDLVLTSVEELSVLASAFEAEGVPALYVTHAEIGLWYATLNADEQFAEPEPSIAAMLTAIESLEIPLRSVWNGCSLREFNIGYDCGAEPWSFNQGLSTALLGRITAARAALRITLYPDRTPSDT
jgi:hypothetical protein